jgi:hypothetical protein
MEDRPESDPVIAGFGDRLPQLGNEQLLACLDLLLLEAERRLLRYARRGPEILEMADEGLVFAVRSGARLRQAQSAAAHCAGHLQVLGVGAWSPRSTNPGWASDPRLTTNESPGEHGQDS